MAAKKIRLFKIASEINIGKENIVEFLQSKGYDIQNKPTAILSEEMVDAIYDKFKKEKQAAEVQRKKIQKHKDIRKASKQKETDKDSDEDEKKKSDKSDVKKEEKKKAEVVEDKVEEATNEVEEVAEKQEEKDTEEATQEEKEKAEVVEDKKSEEPTKEVKKETEEVEEDKKSEEPEEPKEENKDIKGVKVVGKIDIKEDTKKRKKKRRKKKDEDGDDDFTSKKKKRKPREIDIEKASKRSGKDSKKKKKKRKKSIREQISEEDIDKAIKKTLAGMEEGSGSNRQKTRQKKKEERKEKEQQEQELKELEERTLKLTEYVTTSDLADQMDIDVNDIIVKCMELGLMVTINQRLDKDTITLISDDYGFDVEFVDEETLEALEDFEDAEEDLKPRSPIVTIMGHVDHGKTSLLDYIRNENVVAGESGGITQHIGAYMVDMENDKHITFLDTPGHEAFTAMRARGAKITDIVILVVAADDDVMPQTKEAISHAQAADVPIVVAINKMDKPDANPDKVMQQLSENGILVEDWGGKYQCAKISAKTGDNIDSLLEKILLEAELLELSANPDRVARGTVVEAHMDKGFGSVATVVVQKGTLKQGDSFVAGTVWGRVRAMFDERDHKVEEAGPSHPVRLIGFDSLPTAGDVFAVVKSDTEARNIASERNALKREQEMRQVRHVTLDDISDQIKIGGVEVLNLILKADVSGSLEALSDSLLKLSKDEVKVNILHKGVGAVTENDVNLALASNAVIIGFHVKVPGAVSNFARDEDVEIRNYEIIYDCVNDIKNALEGMLKPEIKEEISGTIEVRDLFKVSRLGTIAGCYVLEGKVKRNDRARLLRDGLPVYEGKIDSLKRGKDDVKEVKEKFECGILLDNYNDIKIGDIIETFREVEVKRKFK